jgi:hypothetical protein
MVAGVARVSGAAGRPVELRRFVGGVPPQPIWAPIWTLAKAWSALSTLRAIPTSPLRPLGAEREIGTIGCPLKRRRLLARRLRRAGTEAEKEVRLALRELLAPLSAPASDANSNALSAPRAEREGTRRFSAGEGEVGTVGALQSPPHPGPKGSGSLITSFLSR